ncbi:unnamed protein product [Caenorhabditis auriculariae]|uniref:Glycosyltransferase family 92 protein n=1 Tax=Caenorhabditis auriculariae TaxID=2777116 RepID=A0A8S1H3M8_9PELO|nr:unnamed protein product [Caenorhabditis auriculariae]
MRFHGLPRFRTGRKYLRLLFLLLNVVFCITVITLLTGLTIFDRQHNNIVHDYVARKDDMIVLSTTFYKESKSFDPNTAVILFNAVQVFHLKHDVLNVKAETAADEEIDVLFKVQPVIGQLPFFCKWVPFIAVGQLPKGTIKAKLSTYQGEGMKLSLRDPFRAPRKVVACFSPLFLNERWQLLLATMEIYSHYGAFMQFYVRSMITDLMTIVYTYKNVRVTPWPAVKLGRIRANGPTFDPNRELEFRNQAAAMTDCLLMYKESAEFVLFPDPDDIIIPHLARDYYGEFSRVFKMFPNAGAISYNISQASISATIEKGPDTITKEIVPVWWRAQAGHAPFASQGEVLWGKLVVRPERVDSVWIHRSYGIKDDFEQVALPAHINTGLHFRKWTFLQNSTFDLSRVPHYDPLLRNETEYRLFLAEDGEKIDKSFRRRINKEIVKKVYARLPTVSLYYPLIESCYNRIFYTKEQHSTCKGPEYCEIPSFPGLKCVNVESSFTTYAGYSNLYIHQLLATKFVYSDNGCKL